MKVIAYYERGWFDSEVTDFRMWDHLCRAYGVELQMINDWSEAVIPQSSTIYLMDEEGNEMLDDHEFDHSGVYVFGRTGMRLPLSIPNYNYIIRIPTPNNICLFGIVSAAVLLGAKWQSL